MSEGEAARGDGADFAGLAVMCSSVPEGVGKNRFVPIGLAELSGKPGTWYERDLSAG